MKMTNYFSHWRIRKPGYRDNCTNTDLDNLMISVQKSSVARNKASWRVVPKDSCEVYKDRRKRQMDSDHTDENRKSSSKHRNNIKPRTDKKKLNPRRRARTSGKVIRRQKPNYKRRRLSEEYSTYTSDTTADLTNSSIYTTNTSASYTSDSDNNRKDFNKS